MQHRRKKSIVIDTGKHPQTPNDNHNHNHNHSKDEILFLEDTHVEKSKETKQVLNKVQAKWRSAIQKTIQKNTILNLARETLLEPVDKVLRGGSGINLNTILEMVKNDFVGAIRLINNMENDFNTLVTEDYSQASPLSRLPSALTLRDYFLLAFVLQHEHSLSRKEKTINQGALITKTATDFCKQLEIYRLESDIGKNIKSLFLSLCKPGKSRNTFDQLHHLTLEDNLADKFPALHAYLQQKKKNLENELYNFMQAYVNKHIDTLKIKIFKTGVNHLHGYKNELKQTLMSTVINPSIDSARSTMGFVEQDKDHKSVRKLKESEQVIQDRLQITIQDTQHKLETAAAEDQVTRDQYKEFAVMFVVSAVSMALNAAIGPLAGNIVSNAVLKLADKMGGLFLNLQAQGQNISDGVVQGINALVGYASAAILLHVSAEQSTLTSPTTASIVAAAEEMFENVKNEIMSRKTLQRIAEEELKRRLNANDQIDSNYLITMETLPSIESLEKLLLVKRLTSGDMNIFVTTPDKTKLYLFPVSNGKAYTVEQEILMKESETSLSYVIERVYELYHKIELLRSVQPPQPLESGVLYLIKTDDEIHVFSLAFAPKTLSVMEFNQFSKEFQFPARHQDSISIGRNERPLLFQSIIQFCQVSQVPNKKFLKLMPDQITLLREETNYTNPPLTSEILPRIMETAIVNWATGAMQRVVDKVGGLTQQLVNSEDLYNTIAVIDSFAAVKSGDKMMELLKAQTFFKNPLTLELKSVKQQEQLLNALIVISHVFKEFHKGNLNKVLLLTQEERKNIIKQLVVAALKPEFDSKPNVIMYLIYNSKGLSELFHEELNYREFCKEVCRVMVQAEHPSSAFTEKLLKVVSSESGLQEKLGPDLYALILKDKIQDLIDYLRACEVEHKKDEKEHELQKKTNITTTLIKRLTEALALTDIEVKLKGVKAAFVEANQSFGLKAVPHERSLRHKMGFKKASIKEVLNAYNFGEYGLVYFNDLEKYLTYPETPMTPTTTPLHFLALSPSAPHKSSTEDGDSNTLNSGQDDSQSLSAKFTKDEPPSPPFLKAKPHFLSILSPRAANTDNAYLTVPSPQNIKILSSPSPRVATKVAQNTTAFFSKQVNQPEQLINITSPTKLTKPSPTAHHDPVSYIYSENDKEDSELSTQESLSPQFSPRQQDV